MAVDSWADDYYDDFNHRDVRHIVFGNDRHVDHHAQELFMQAMFDKDDRAYLDLIEYMHDEYGIDFEDSFHWMDFREWYEGQQAA